MLPRGSLLAALLLAGCEDNLLHIEFPPVDGQSMILAITTAEGLRLEGIPLSPAPAQIKFRTDESPLFIETLIYDQPLAELGLNSGEIALFEGGSPLPPPKITFRAENAGGDFGVWVEARSSDAVSAFRVKFPEPSACSKFAVETFGLEETMESVTFMLPLEARLALVGTRDYLYWFEENGPRRFTTMPANLPMDGGTISATGVIWLGGGERLWRGRIQGEELIGGEFPTLLPSPGSRIRWLGATEDHVYLLTRAGELWILDVDAERFSLLHRFTPHEFDEGGVTARSNGSMAAVYGSENTIVRTKNGTISVERLDIESVGLSSVVLLDGYGLIAGTTAGQLIFEQQGRYVVRRDTGFGGRVRLILQLGDGLLFAGGSGVVAEYDRPTDDICPGVPQAATSIYNGVNFGGGVLLGGNRMFDQTVLTLLIPE